VGVAVDGAGALYIADWGGGQVRRVGTDGTITTVAGAPGFSGDGGLPTEAQLANPYGVAVDRAGTVHVADDLNRRVRRFGSRCARPGTGVVAGRCR
jgi:hypothetical protein